MRFASILIALLFTSLSANAYLIGSVKGTITNGCDACGHYLGLDLLPGFTDFGLGFDANLAGKSYTFAFAIKDAVFARPPLFDGQGGMAARWMMGPGDITGGLTVNHHTVKLRGAHPHFNTFGIGYDHSFVFNFDMDGVSPYFDAAHPEFMHIGFDSNGLFSFAHTVDVVDPRAGPLTWQSIFNATVDSVTLRPGAQVPEPTSLALLLVGALALVTYRRG